MGSDDIWRDQEARRGSVEQARENASRPGRAFAEYSTVGGPALSAGFYEPAVFGFGVAFIERPTFTTGMALTEPDDDNGNWDTPAFVPYYTVVVHQWRRNSNGFYTGAWCGFRSIVDTDWAVTFSMAWEGVASKDFVSSQHFPVGKLDV